MESNHHQSATDTQINESASLKGNENEVNIGQVSAVNPNNSTKSVQPTFEKFIKLRKIQNGGLSKILRQKKKKTKDKYVIFGNFVAQELHSLKLESNCKLLKRMIQKAILKVSANEDKSEICVDERKQFSKLIMNDDIHHKESDISCIPEIMSQTTTHLDTLKVKTELQDAPDEAESSFLQEMDFVQIKIEEDEHSVMIPDEQCSENNPLEDTGRFKCNTCSKTFSLKGNLKKHLVVHSDDNLYTCNVCGRTFNRKNNLDIHLRRHADDRRHSCEICNKSFLTNSELQVHYCIHTGKRPYKCISCGKSFYTKSNLNVHSRVHKGEKPYACIICNKSFVQKGGLNYHIVKVHQQEHGYPCDMCSKIFNRKRNLDAHSCNTESHYCQVCNRTFSRKAFLQRHLRTHTGERPFSCDICEKTFTLKHSLIYHMKRHVNI